MAGDRERVGTSDLGNKANFGVGSHIKCRYRGMEVEGEVLAFENNSRLLIIRSPSTSGKSSSNNVHVISADCVEKISVEGSSPTDVLRPIDFQKITKRREKAIGTKQARIRALAADVSSEGKRLFLTIVKTIDEVSWDGQVIVVLNEVRISPPYEIDNVEGEKEASCVHIKKIVEKFWKDQQQSPQ